MKHLGLQAFVSTDVTKLNAEFANHLASASKNSV
jgi:hypothetical protein